MLEIRGKSLINLNVNGSVKNVAVRPADNLLYVLREKLGLTGTKNGCENGDCDTCTILVDGWPVKSCLMLAVEAIGHDITTIEGLINTPIQNAFVEKFAVQCGYCTPGMLIVAWHLLREGSKVDEVTVRQALSGSLCRCTGYVKPVRAVLLAAQREKVIAHGHAPGGPGGPAAAPPGGGQLGGQPGGPAAPAGGERP